MPPPADAAPAIALVLDAALPLTVALARVGGLFATEPFLSSRLFPLRVRAVAALGLAVALLPAVSPLMPHAEALDAGSMVRLTASEVGVGALVGLCLRVVWHAMQMAGDLIGLQIGLKTGALIDPIGGSGHGDVLSNLMGFTALSIMVSGDGHHLAIRALAATWRHVPPGAFRVDAGAMEAVSNLTGLVLHTGLAVSMPVLGAVLLTQLGLAIVGRAVPQLNVFVVGFMVTITLGLVVLGQSLGGMEPAIERGMAEALDHLRAIFQ
jgi:flagellar biosynthetic protein FliR